VDDPAVQPVTRVAAARGWDGESSRHPGGIMCPGTAGNNGAARIRG
jgi:hypothetical protein